MTDPNLSLEQLTFLVDARDQWLRKAKEHETQGNAAEAAAARAEAERCEGKLAELQKKLDL